MIATALSFSFTDLSPCKCFDLYIETPPPKNLKSTANLPVSSLSESPLKGLVIFA